MLIYTVYGLCLFCVVLAAAFAQVFYSYGFSFTCGDGAFVYELDFGVSNISSFRVRCMFLVIFCSSG